MKPCADQVVNDFDPNRKALVQIFAPWDLAQFVRMTVFVIIVMPIRIRNLLEASISQGGFLFHLKTLLIWPGSKPKVLLLHLVFFF